MNLIVNNYSDTLDWTYKKIEKYCMTTMNKVYIMHHFSDKPPRGWKNKETISFHVLFSTTVDEVLENINIFRRPSEQLLSLLDV